MIADLKTSAEVVGSNPTRSTFIVLVKHGIRISSFFDLGHLRLMMELFYPLLLSWNVSKMGMLNNRNRKMSLLRSIHLVATIFTLTIIFASTTTLVSASTIGNNTTTTTSVGGEEQEAVSTMTTASNISNATLGSLFLTEEAEFTSFNPINQTYIEISYVGNATIMPPNATNSINATETGNITLNIQPNGVNFAQGQSLLVIDEGDNGAQEEENATTTFVELSRVGPGDTGSGTGVAFFNTNSTGKLAFLDNMLAIYQHEMYPGVDTIREWEWKGGTLPLETGGSARSMGEQEAVSSTTNTTNNNVSNAALGSLFLTGENIEFNVNPINETYSVISYLGSRIIMPPYASGIVINATETGNVTSNIQPNGLSIEQGQGFIVTEDGAAAEKEENATFTYVMLSRANPDGTGSGTGVAFLNTNSTGQLAFLDNMLAIAHVEFSPEGSTLKMWEWKGGTLPLETGGSGATPPVR